MDKTCLSYWFPKLEAAGLPVPRTEIVRTDCDLMLYFFGGPKDPPKPTEAFNAFLVELEAARQRIGGTAVFLRTGQTSGKHDWKRTCYLPVGANLAHHVGALVEFSECADFMGLPWNVWVVREMLPIDPIGICERYGNMPVVREFRYFIADGAVTCWHPYWPLDALNDGGFAADVPEGWYEAMCRHDEAATALATRVAAVFRDDGAWSVDVLATRRGWVVTDMAEAGISYHWPECPHAPR